MNDLNIRVDVTKLYLYHEALSGKRFTEEEIARRGTVVAAGPDAQLSKRETERRLAVTMRQLVDRLIGRDSRIPKQLTPALLIAMACGPKPHKRTFDAYRDKTRQHIFRRIQYKYDRASSAIDITNLQALWSDIVLAENYLVQSHGAYQDAIEFGLTPLLNAFKIISASVRTTTTCTKSGVTRAETSVMAIIPISTTGQRMNLSEWIAPVSSSGERLNSCGSDGRFTRVETRNYHSVVFFQVMRKLVQHNDINITLDIDQLEGRELCGLICWSGYHYIAYVKRAQMWFKCNDSTATEIQDLRVVDGKTITIVVFGKSFRHGAPVGIWNRAATCYLAAAFQVMLNLNLAL